MIDRRNPHWPATRDWLNDRIADCHRQLERSDCSEQQANLNRGMIAAYRGFIKTVEPTEIPVVEEPGYFG